jgi:hypothetical protein
MHWRAQAHGRPLSIKRSFGGTKDFNEWHNK